MAVSATDVRSAHISFITTDPGAVKDFAAFCRSAGNELMESTDEDGVYLFKIQKGS